MMRAGLLPLLIALAGAGAAADPGWALTTDGRIVDVGSFAGSGVVASTGSTAWAACVAAHLPGEVPAWMDQGLVTVAGDVVRGPVDGFGPAGLRLRSDLFGAVQLPAAAVAALVLRDLPVVQAQREAVAGKPGLLLANGDRLAGTPTTIDERAVGIDTGRRTMQIPRERVVVVRFATPAAPPAEGAWVRLANGDRLIGTPGGAGETLTIDGCLGRRELRQPWVRAAGASGQRLLPLTQVAPASTSQRSALGEPPRWLVDRGDRPGWVVAGGMRVERALLWRSGQEATWELDGSWQRLVCLVAQEEAPGSCAFQVEVDGKTAFTSQPLPGRGPARPLSVPVAGAKRLRLAVLPGADGVTAGDRPAWLYPVLVK